MSNRTTLGDVLEYGAIVSANDELGALITWNGSATFNWWVDRGQIGWANVDIKTVYEVNTLDQAISIARHWVESEGTGDC